MTIIDEKKCSGCTSCQNICSNNAIIMEYNNEGFLIPKIDKSICINCGLCKKICPIFKERQNSDYRIKCFAAINKNDKIRFNSSSGGIFSTISDYIFSKKGIVIGAAFDYSNRLRHIIAQNNNELIGLMGSKYIQSDTSDIYHEIEKHLKKNKYVYFVGTPCQVAGLKSFLRKEYEKLICSDLICHGVPSTKIFNLYLKEKSKNDNIIKQINFRNKTSGWKDFSIKLVGTKELYIKKHNEDIFFQLFKKNLILRESCYECKFKSKNSYADITLGDFWGINCVFPDLDDDKGVSAILIRNEKGLKIWNEILNNIEYKECNICDISIYNSALVESVMRPKVRESILKINYENINELQKYLKKPNLIIRIIEKVKSILKKL